MRWTLILEEAGLAFGEFAAEVLVGARGGDAAAGCAVDHANLHEVGFVHFFDGVFFFRESRSEGAEADGSAGIFVEHRDHEVPIDFVEATFIGTEHGERFLCYTARDAASGANFREISCAAQKPIGDARCSTATTGNFFGAAFVHFNGKNFGGAVKNDEQVFRLVKFEAVDDAEAGTKRRGDESGARGGAD